MITDKRAAWYIFLFALVVAVYLESGKWTAVAIAMIAIRVELQAMAHWVLGRILHEKGVLSKQDIDRVVKGG